MKNTTTLLASIGLSSLLLVGCCPCALKHNNCPQKHPATPMVVPQVSEPAAPQVLVPDDAVVAQDENDEVKPGWAVYAIAGGLIVLGLGIRFLPRKK